MFCGSYSHSCLKVFHLPGRYYAAFFYFCFCRVKFQNLQVGFGKKKKKICSEQDDVNKDRTMTHYSGRLAFFFLPNLKKKKLVLFLVHLIPDHKQRVSSSLCLCLCLGLLLCAPHPLSFVKYSSIIIDLKPQRAPSSALTRHLHICTSLFLSLAVCTSVCPCVVVQMCLSCITVL